MIDSDTLLTIGTFILLPYIINYFTKKSPAIPKKIKPRQRFDSLITFIILIYTISTTYNTLYLPRNFLNLIKGQLDSPTYILRNGFRQYMSQTYPEWTESTSQTNELILSDEWLYGKLLSTANRRLYLIHGDEAFVGCKWCTESSDYTYFNVSELSGVYAFAVFIIGFAGYLRRKNFYLVYGLMVVFGLFLLDMVRLFFDQKLDSALSDNEYNDMWRMRYGVLSALGICMTLVNGKDEITDTDVLLDILGKQRDIYFKEQSIRLANSTILGTTELRTRFMEYHSEKGALSAAILRDPDILELKRKVLAKFDLERIAKEVNMYVDGLVELGHGGDRETGILQDDEVIENIETNQKGNDSNGPHRRR